MQFRRLLATDGLAQSWGERERMGYYAQNASNLEANKLSGTIVTWWDAIEVLIVTGSAIA